MENPIDNNANLNNNLPAKVSVWTKIRNFLCQDIEFNLTPMQEKVFQEVHDFWHQEITGESVHNLLFKQITGEGFKNFWLKEIEITGDIEL